jgi:ribosomal protein S12 methylthiotransferase accessory factor
MSAGFRADTHLLDVADALIDPRYGIIESVVEVPRHAGGPNFFTFHAQACDTTAFAGQRNFGSTAGSSSKRERALAKALGEAIERYCSAIYDPDEFIMSSYRDAPHGAIHPSTLALYSEEQYANPQFPFARFSTDLPVRWTTSIDLTDEQVVFVPASMVNVPYYFGPGEAPILQPISSGLACHTTYEKAAINGICEVVERDSFTLAWMQCFSPPSIDLNSLDGECLDIVGRFERTGREIALLDITRDTRIPTVLAIQLSDHAEVPGFVVAAATAPRAAIAVRKSLEELALTSHYMQGLHTSNLLGGARPPQNVVTQDDHLRFWCYHENKALATFLFNRLGTTRCVSLSDKNDITSDNDAAILKELVSRITNRGYRVLISDVTTEEMIRLHLFVVRAIIPGFHPLFIGHDFRALGGTRLRSAPEWGSPDGAFALSDKRVCRLNPAPHPYP